MTRNVTSGFVLMCAALALVGCGAPEPPAPAPVTMPDVPAVDLPDEASPGPPLTQPAFDDELGDLPMTPPKPAWDARPTDADEAVEPNMQAPPTDDSAAADGKSPGMARALGAALLKGITQGAGGNP